MQYIKVVKGASEEEAKYLSQFKNEAVLRKASPLKRYQYAQFRSGAFVKQETRDMVEEFYKIQLAETEYVLDTILQKNA